MKVLSRLTIAGFIGSVVLLSTPVLAQQQQTFITIGTGGITGVYYPAGGAICRLVNQGRKDHGIRCTVESTGGSVFNVNAITSGDINLGMSQGDVQFFALRGEGPFKDRGANRDLRALFALHPEAMTIVARRDANIKSWTEIKGKRLNIGDPGSGNRVMTEDLMRESNLKVSDLKLATDLKPAEMASALCDNKIDAFTYVVGHPNAAIKEATTTCSATVISVPDSEISKVLKGAPYYSGATIPARMYGDHGDIKTFGVRATLVTSAKLPDNVAYAIVKAVFDNLEEFKKLHPALANLSAQDMLSGNTAPYHEGALRYFREKGLMK
ncbi:MAG: TAXI family TRAP transporter solute-binding subunit [Burkholderiales bacterium]|jgi:TRAP transporter TAXI family solute receptor|nr:TAXI family TRAP transporter solute-binding subunit [Burkholderiales bacterium]